MHSPVRVHEPTKDGEIIYFLYLVNLDTGDEKKLEGDKRARSDRKGTCHFTVESARAAALKRLSRMQYRWSRPYPPTINIRDQFGRLMETLNEDDIGT